MSVARRSHRALKRLRGEEHLLSFFSDFEPAIRIAAGERLLELDRQRSAGQWPLELDRLLRDHPEPELLSLAQQLFPADGFHAWR
jgi:hypothetical protein